MFLYLSYLNNSISGDIGTKWKQRLLRTKINIEADKALFADCLKHNWLQDSNPLSVISNSKEFNRQFIK